MKLSIDLFYFGPTDRTIIKVLQEREFVTINTLIDAVYAGAKMPEYPAEGMRVKLTRLRAKLKKQGIKLESSSKGGQGNWANYRLVNE